MSKVFGMAIVFLLSLWITTEYGAELWGNYALVLAILYPVCFFCLIGTDTLTVKHVARSDLSEKYKNSILIIFAKLIFAITIPTVTALTMLLIFIAPEVLYSSSQNVITTSLLIGISVFLMTWYHFSLGILRGLKDIVNFGLFQNVLPMMLFFLSLLLLHSVGNGLTITKLLALHSSVYGTLLILIYLVIKKRKAKSKHSQICSGNQFGFPEAVKEGLPIMMIALMGMTLTYTDILIISYFHGSQYVAVYDIAIKFSALAALILVAVNAYIMPRVSELYSGKRHDELAALINKCSALIFWASLPFALLGLTIAPFLMGLYGDQFMGGVVSLRLLLIAQFLSAMCGSVSVILQMTGNQSSFQWIFGFAVCVNIFLNLILVPTMGINGAAAATLISTIVWNFASALLVYKRLNISTIYYPLKSK